MGEADGTWAALVAAADAARRGLDPDRIMQAHVAAHGEADRSLIDLYAPVLRRPVTVGHLGQSLDGCIATHTGDSYFVTGEQNLLHLHRLRALADAIVVGAGTVAADDPRLTTRLAPGPNPLRVVIDPARRLPPHHRVFCDGEAPTLLVCEAGHALDGPDRIGHAEVVGVATDGYRLDLGALLDVLRRRGCHGVFVEGGGATVSAFLEAGLLDRLQITVAPLIIGEGRLGIRLPPSASLAECLRLRHRVFRMGDDILFDCDLRAAPPPRDGPLLSRII